MVRSHYKQPASRKAPFQVGDRVQFGFGRRTLRGTIIEDHGPIGVQGRHLFQVNVPMDPFEPMAVELAEDDLVAIPPGDEPADSIDHATIVEFLAQGGLISILRSNMSGGTRQPRVWLCRDSLDNMTYTFDEARGLVGGQPIPQGALRNAKVSASRRDGVVAFVEGFGLTHDEAVTVVNRAGTA